jgi:hypothetical protein
MALSLDQYWPPARTVAAEGEQLRVVLVMQATVQKNWLASRSAARCCPVRTDSAC